MQDLICICICILGVQYSVPIKRWKVLLNNFRSSGAWFVSYTLIKGFSNNLHALKNACHMLKCDFGRVSLRVYKETYNTQIFNSSDFMLFEVDEIELGIAPTPGGNHVLCQFIHFFHVLRLKNFNLKKNDRINNNNQ